MTYAQEYQKRNPEKFKRNSKKYYDKLRNAVLSSLGGVCVRCSFSDARALQIDHVHGGGRKELSSIARTAYWRMVLASVAVGEGKYQLLCANCNWIKKEEDRQSKTDVV